MIPSSEQVAQNVRRHCAAMAEEIVRRVEAVAVRDPAVLAVIEVEAQRVLLDWFLGDWLPPAGEKGAKLPEQGDSNSPVKEGG